MDIHQLEQEMILVLTAAMKLTASSKNHGWPDEDPLEAVDVLDRMIAHLQDRLSPPPPYACIQFVPTGPLQEIAMANGWHDEYMALADQFDDLERRLKRFRPAA